MVGYHKVITLRDKSSVSSLESLASKPNDFHSSLYTPKLRNEAFLSSIKILILDFNLPFPLISLQLSSSESYLFFWPDVDATTYRLDTSTEEKTQFFLEFNIRGEKHKNILD